MLLLTAVDLITLNHDYHPQVAAAIADPPAPPALRQARALVGHDRVMGLGGTLYPNLADRYDVLDPRQHDHPVPERFEQLFAGLGGGKPNPWIVSPTDPRTAKLADLFAARYLLTPAGTLERNTGALPRAWMAYAWRRSRSPDEALFSLVAASARQSRDAPAIEGAPPSPAPGLPAGPASVVVDRDERVDVRVDARRAGYLVLDDSFYPGWDATVDGRSARILPANVNFRAVAVPAGVHTVSFRYRPTSAVAGAGISGFTAAAMAIAAVVLWIRRRRSTAPAGPSPPPGSARSRGAARPRGRRSARGSHDR